MYMVSHQFDSAYISQLEGRGISRADILHGKKKLDLRNMLFEFQCRNSAGRPHTTTSKAQLNYVRRFLSDPYDSFRCIGISSYPSDLLAKQVAIWMYDHAFKQYRNSKALRTAVDRTPPLWHRVFGGLGDKLLDSHEKPCFLVISNVTIDSTNFKLEKVRDLLEKYNNIPRIVVMSGTDPVSFFRNRLYYPIDAGLQIGTSGKHTNLAQDID